MTPQFFLYLLLSISLSLPQSLLSLTVNIPSYYHIVYIVFVHISKGLTDALARGMLTHIHEILVATSCCTAIAALCEGDVKSR